MTTIASSVFATSILLVFLAYFGYPVLVFLLSLFRHSRPRQDDSYLPQVSLVLCAYNEEDSIEGSLRAALDLDYPPDRIEILVGSDGSTDRTNEIITSIKDPRIRPILREERIGKSSLLNELVPQAKGEIIVFTDANSVFHPQVVRDFTKHFADPRVGLVTGEMHWLDRGPGSAVAQGSQSYWRYESAIKYLENKIGSVLVCVGSCFAMRKELFRTLMPEVANDFQIPMEVADQDKLLLYEPHAYSSEYAPESGRQEFQRTVRIVVQGITGVVRMWGKIRGLRRFQVLTRKVLRWLVPDFLILALISNLFLLGTFAGRILLVGQGLLYLAAVSGSLFLRITGGRLPVFLALPYYFCLLNLAALSAQIQFWRGKKFTTWQPTSDGRGKGSS